MDPSTVRLRKGVTNERSENLLKIDNSNDPETEITATSDVVDLRDLEKGNSEKKVNIDEVDNAGGESGRNIHCEEHCIKISEQFSNGAGRYRTPNASSLCKRSGTGNFSGAKEHGSRSLTMELRNRCRRNQDNTVIHIKSEAENSGNDCICDKMHTRKDTNESFGKGKRYHEDRSRSTEPGQKLMKNIRKNQNPIRSMKGNADILHDRSEGGRFPALVDINVQQDLCDTRIKYCATYNLGCNPCVRMYEQDRARNSLILVDFNSHKPRDCNIHMNNYSSSPLSVQAYSSEHLSHQSQRESGEENLREDAEMEDLEAQDMIDSELDESSSFQCVCSDTAQEHPLQTDIVNDGTANMQIHVESRNQSPNSLAHRTFLWPVEDTKSVADEDFDSEVEVYEPCNV